MPEVLAAYADACQGAEDYFQLVGLPDIDVTPLASVALTFGAVYSERLGDPTPGSQPLENSSKLACNTLQRSGGCKCGSSPPLCPPGPAPAQPRPKPTGKSITICPTPPPTKS